jgi:hypothetical protein
MNKHTMTLLNPLPESGPLPSAFYRALGKEDFAERRTRQSPALGKELIYRAQDTRHSQALGKDCFAESQTLGKDGSRQRVVSGRQSLPSVKYLALGKKSLCRVSSVDTRQSIFLFFLFWSPNFLWYVPTLCRHTCTILRQL